MHISTWLSCLDLEALRETRRLVDELLHARAQERRHGAWVVEGYLQTLHRFHEAGYVKAAEALLEAAREIEQHEPKLHRRVLSLNYKLLPASECADLST